MTWQNMWLLSDRCIVSCSVIGSTSQILNQRHRVIRSQAIQGWAKPARRIALIRQKWTIFRLGSLCFRFGIFHCGIHKYGELCSSVGIATCYGMDGSRIESWLGWPRFSAPFKNGPGAHPASCTMGTWSLCQGIKRPGACRWPPTPNLSQRY